MIPIGSESERAQEINASLTLFSIELVNDRNRLWPSELKVKLIINAKWFWQPLNPHSRNYAHPMSWTAHAALTKIP